MARTTEIRTTEASLMADHLVDIQWCVDCRSEMPDESLIQQWVELCLKELSLKELNSKDLDSESVEFCLRVVNEAEIQSLNRQYRGQDKPTNVLSFPNEYFGKRMADENGRILLGDIIICKEIVQAESQCQGKSVDAHFAHLLIHGLLHLQGYDHSMDDQATEMETIEIRLMQNLGYEDPYV